MGPKKKRQNKNDFYFFMMEEREQLGREGRVWRNMAELAEICGPRWQQLTDVEKAKFKQKAKEAKEAEKGELLDKFDTFG